jgi:alcohol dehydrogenase YqhD (iron-dependent ADH family)
MPSLILVPTLAASGSEASNVSVITNWDLHEKSALVSPYLLPNVSIVDPELTLKAPLKTIARGGVDIFLHVAERYITTETLSPLSDGIRETVMRLAVEASVRALEKPDDIEARTDLSWASTVANSPLITEMGGGGGFPTLHGISHALSAHYDIAHPDSLAMLLIAWMKYTYPVRKERFDSLGENVFRGNDGIAGTEEWLERIGMKLRLKDFGVELERFEELARCSVETEKMLVLHPLPLNIPAIKHIYQESY